MDVRTLPCEGVVCSPPGDQITDLRPGDIILTEGFDWVSVLIRFGQAIRYKGDAAKYADWTHTAVVKNRYGDLIEAVGGKGVIESNINKYDPKFVCLIKIEASDEDREQIVEQAKQAVGQGYSAATFISAGLAALTGMKFSFGLSNQKICSSLVSLSLHKAKKYDFDQDFNNISPADLAQYFKVEKPT